MTDEIQNREQMLLGVAALGPTNHVKRLALVVEDSRASHAVAALRGLIKTFVVESISELRAALTLQFSNQYDHEQSLEGNGSAGFIGIDITRLPFPDTALLALSMRATYQIGVVYILTRAQFETFEEGTFDFVVR